MRESWHHLIGSLSSVILTEVPISAPLRVMSLVCFALFGQHGPCCTDGHHNKITAMWKRQLPPRTRKYTEPVTPSSRGQTHSLEIWDRADRSQARSKRAAVDPAPSRSKQATTPFVFLLVAPKGGMDEEVKPAQLTVKTHKAANDQSEQPANLPSDLSRGTRALRRASCDPAGELTGAVIPEGAHLHPPCCPRTAQNRALPSQSGGPLAYILG